MNAHPRVTQLLLPLVLLLAPAPGVAQAPDTPEQVIGDRVAVPGGSYWNVSVAELRTMLTAEDKPLLVNTHIPFQGDIEGTDVSIAFNEIQDHLDELPADRSDPLVLYCRSGPMSERAAATLVELGYTRVYSLEGGFNAWAAAGLPMVNP